MLLPNNASVSNDVTSAFEFGKEEGVCFEVTKLYMRDPIAEENDEYGDRIFLEFPFELTIKHDNAIVEHVSIVDESVHGQINVQLEHGYLDGESVITARIAVKFNIDEDYVVNQDTLILKEAQYDAEVKKREFFNKLQQVVNLCLQNRQRTLGQYYHSIIKHMGEYYTKHTKIESALLLEAFTSFPIAFNPKTPCCFEVVCNEGASFKDAHMTIKFQITSSSLVKLTISKGTEVSRVALLCHAVPLLYKEGKHFYKFKNVHQLAQFLEVSEGVSSKNDDEIKNIQAKNQEYKDNLMGTVMQRQKMRVSDSCLYLSDRTDRIDKKIKALEMENRMISADTRLNKQKQQNMVRAINKKLQRLRGLLQKTKASQETARNQRDVLCGEDNESKTTLMQNIREQVCKKNDIKIEALEAQKAAFIGKRNAILCVNKLNQLHQLLV